MPKKLIKPGILLATVFVVISLLFVTAGATTVNVLDGQVSIADTAGRNTVSGGTVTIKAKGGLLGKETNNITITNETESQAKLSFDYSVAKANSFKIAGAATAEASGSYSAILEAGGSVAITLVSNSGFSNTTATLTLSNFSLTAVAASSNVTINFDSSRGSVTANGEAITSGAVKEGSATNGIDLVATASSGAKFLGWVDEDGKILSTATSYTLEPVEDMTIKAMFAEIGGSPVFMLGTAATILYESKVYSIMTATSFNYYTISKGYLFEGLNEAIAATSELNVKNMVLMNDAVLPAGTYTIPAGVTLLIPFDDANTMYTTLVQSQANYVTPSAYRTLTMADGAKLVLNGSMSLSAKQTYAQGSTIYGCAPTGAVSFVRMQGSSNITVNNGGALYAYGFITGSGSVTANSGATIYEMFQFRDFRGGTQSTDSNMKDHGVFPLSQYYVQNIEVPMTLHAGATEFACTTIYMSSADFGSAVKFIANSGAMFNLSNGYVVKTYDGTKDRLVVDVYGDITLSSVEMKVSMSSINSKDYELGINSNITVNVNSGTFTIKQDLAILPGVKFNIEKDATVKLNSGNSIYVYDADQWGTFVYSKGNVKFKPVNYAPGQSYTRTDANLTDVEIVVKGTFDASAGYLYTTAGGANICGEEGGVVKLTAGTQTVTYQLVQNTGYTEIPITPAYLKNADGSYLHGATDTYVYRDGKWNCTSHTSVADAAVAATCTTTGLTEGEHCSVCNEVLVAQEVVAALGHNYASEVTAPTCTDSGYTTYTCTVCGDSYIDNAVDALGHSYESVVTAPTCTEQGYTTHTCTVCGDSYVDNYVAATGHSYSWSAWAADKAEFTSTSSCATCGDEQTITVLLEYRMDRYIWLNATVSSTLGTPVCSNEAIAYGTYLVQKVPSDEITTSVEVTFTVDGVAGATPVLDVGFLSYKSAIYNTSDEKTKNLLAAMENFGKAADMYFPNQGNGLLEAPTDIVDPDVSKERVEGPGSISFGEIGITTTGATIYFDEALRLSVGYEIAGVGEDGTIKIGDDTYTVVQIGFLAKKLTVEDGKWVMCDSLTASYAAEAGDDVTAYIAYNAAGKDVSAGGKDNYPFAGYGGEGVADKLSEYSGIGEITFDLKVAEYKAGFGIRTFAVLQKGETDEYVCVYGKQYGYGLEAYIKAMYGSDDKAFNDLLATAWSYAKASYAKNVEEGSSIVVPGGQE